MRGRARILLAAAVVLAASLLFTTPLQLLLTVLWDDEDNPFIGVFIGTPGVLRARLRRQDEQGGEGDSDLVFARDLDALIKVAHSRFSMDVDSIVIASSGETLRMIENGDGTRCIADALRCVHDGALLLAIERTANA